MVLAQLDAALTHPRAVRPKTRSSSAPGSNGNRDGWGLNQPLDRSYQLIDDVTQTLFDAIGDRFVGTLVVCSHAQRLNFSMGFGREVSTDTTGKQRRAGEFAVRRCDRLRVQRRVIRTCMSI